MQYAVLSNDPIAPLVHRMRLEGDTRSILCAGQFVQLALPGFFLRRPISVCDWQPGEQGMLEIIYKVVGHGTEALAQVFAGTTMDVLPGLGNGYDTEGTGEHPLLVGGGVGAPPLYGLCKKLLKAEKTPTVILGFNTKEEIFLQAEFESLGIPCLVCTADGTAGVKGFVTEGMKMLEGQYDYVFTCGPTPMLKAVHAICMDMGTKGQFSFEERMACGFGVCMGCSCQTKNGSKRICKDGPVLREGEIIW